MKFVKPEGNNIVSYCGDFATKPVMNWFAALAAKPDWTLFTASGKTLTGEIWVPARSFSSIGSVGAVITCLKKIQADNPDWKNASGGAKPRTSTTPVAGAAPRAANTPKKTVYLPRGEFTAEMIKIHIGDDIVSVSSSGELTGVRLDHISNFSIFTDMSRDLIWTVKNRINYVDADGVNVVNTPTRYNVIAGELAANVAAEDDAAAIAAAIEDSVAMKTIAGYMAAIAFTNAAASGTVRLERIESPDMRAQFIARVRDIQTAAAAAAAAVRAAAELAANQSRVTTAELAAAELAAEQSRAAAAELAAAELAAEQSKVAAAAAAAELEAAAAAERHANKLAAAAAAADKKRAARNAIAARRAAALK